MPADEHFFRVPDLAATLPAVADTMLRDLRLTESDAASCRIFRAYRAVPRHFHKYSDEHLYVLSGRALFTLGDNGPREVSPGDLIVFDRNTVHGFPQLTEEPFVVLAFDTPRRLSDDIHFVDSANDPASFMATDPLHAPAALS